MGNSLSDSVDLLIPFLSNYESESYPVSPLLV
jgi:hypothetical protein